MTLGSHSTRPLMVSIEAVPDGPQSGFMSLAPWGLSNRVEQEERRFVVASVVRGTAATNHLARDRVRALASALSPCAGRSSWGIE